MKIAASIKNSNRPQWSQALPLLALWLFISIILLIKDYKILAALDFRDTDDAMRLVQVRDWLNGQAWFDLVQHRMVPPDGAIMHWSRIVDLPLALIIQLLRPVVGNEPAETIAVVIVPLLLLGLAMSLVARLCRDLISQPAGLFGALFFLTAHQSLFQFQPLRIDHHAHQIILVLATLVLLVRVNGGPKPLFAGLAAALSLIIGLETLPYVAAIGGAVALWWLINPAAAPLLRNFGLGLGLGAPALAIVFTPPGSWSSPMCEGMSGFYLAATSTAGALAMVIASIPAAGQTLLRRMASGFSAAFVLLGVVIWINPECLKGPLADLEPRLITIWMTQVTEATPIYVKKIGTIIALLTFPMIGLIGTVIAFASQPDRRPIWGLILCSLLAAVALMFVQVRAGAFAGALAAPGATFLFMAGLHRIQRITVMPLRALTTAMLFLLLSGVMPVVLGSVVQAKSETNGAASKAKSESCDLTAFWPSLQKLPRGIILSQVDLGPAILQNSEHSVVSGPYHLNGEAIVDTFDFWMGSPEKASKIAEKYRADYVLYCPKNGEAGTNLKRAPRGLLAQLNKGVVPQWLTPLPADKRTSVRLYKFNATANHKPTGG